PEDLAHFVSLVHGGTGVEGKRAIEERVVAHLLDEEQVDPFRTSLSEFREQLSGAPWYVLSARRADLLLREKLFDRVFAVRIRGFARHFRNAELDMHYSFSQDFTSLDAFFESARKRGPQGVAVDLERGVM